VTGIEVAVIAAIGAGVTAVGQLQAGANAQKAANFNAQVAFNNANAARLAAVEDGKRQSRLSAKRQGANRAQDPDKLDLLEDNALEEELAFQSIIHAGEIQATGFTNNAQLDIAKGKAAKSASRVAAAGTLLGAASKGFSASKPGTPLTFGAESVGG
tara:strand:+ start:1626 stop:2096 length:471 start_codon:yes stop_codon:yes gene_type:complete